MPSVSSSRPTTYSRASLAVVAAAASGFGALGLLLTDERPAGIGALEPAVLIAAAALYLVGGVATVAGATGPAVWAGRVAVVVVAALALITFTQPGWSSVIFQEISSVVCGVLFVTSTRRARGQ